MEHDRTRWRVWVVGGIVVVLMVVAVAYRLVTSQVNVAGSKGEGGVAQVQVPAGFIVNVFAEGLAEPRFIAFGPDGVLYVAERGNGRIAALPDGDGDGTADTIHSFASDLDRPHSLVFHGGAWYVGVPNGVVRLQDSDGDGTAETRHVIVNDLPAGGNHTTRTGAFLPDGRMVVSVGSSCNACEEEDERRAAVVVYEDPSGFQNPQGLAGQIYASGLRNAVGLALHPATGELWATNNGRDLMGDNVPSETVYIVREGADYGWPRCHSGHIIDPDLGDEEACEGAEQPVVEMQAHSAPLGLAFYTGRTFPEEYWGDLFIAFHGSWNRSVPTGYKVVRVRLEGSEVVGAVEDFAIGWLDEATGKTSGRPVGLAVGPDGALYVSDDKGGFIYRIVYDGGA